MTENEGMQAQRGSKRMMLAPGDVLADRYEIAEFVGEGGMGALYRAVHRQVGRAVAVKILKQGIADDEVSYKRFRQEAKIAGSLFHTNLISVYDFGETAQGRPYLVMDFLSGQTLAEVISRDGQIPVSRALGIALQICEGLDYAHKRGLIHRDLKPSNVMLLTESGRDLVKLMDFGIAKKVEAAAGGDDQNLTRTGEVFGSPLYMSPEQCQGLPLDGRSDIYSLGCMLYEMISGRPPLKGENPIQTICKHLAESPPPLMEAHPELLVAREVDEAIGRCMAKAAEDRFSDVADLSESLNQCLVSQRKLETGLSGTGLPSTAVRGAEHGVSLQAGKSEAEPAAHDVTRVSKSSGNAETATVASGNLTKSSVERARDDEAGSHPSDPVPGNTNPATSKSSVRLPVVGIVGGALAVVLLLVFVAPDFLQNNDTGEESPPQQPGSPVGKRNQVTAEPADSPPSAGGKDHQRFPDPSWRNTRRAGASGKSQEPLADGSGSAQGNPGTAMTSDTITKSKLVQNTKTPADVDGKRPTSRAGASSVDDEAAPRSSRSNAGSNSANHSVGSTKKKMGDKESLPEATSSATGKPLSTGEPKAATEPSRRTPTPEDQRAYFLRNYQTSVIPQVKTETDKVTGCEIEWEIDWASFDNNGLGYLEYAGIYRVRDALRSICQTRVGKDSVQGKIKKVILRNVPPARQRVQFKDDGVLEVLGAWNEGSYPPEADVKEAVENGVVR